MHVVLYPSWCVFVVFQKFEPFRGDRNVPASLEPSSSEADELPSTLRFETFPLKIYQLPFIFFHVSNISGSLSLLFLFLFSTVLFPKCPELTLTKVTHLDWIRRLMLFYFLSIPFPLLFKVLMQRFVPSKPSCSWWKKTQMTIPAHLRTSTTNPPIKKTRGPSPTTSRSANSGDDVSNNCPSVTALKGLCGDELSCSCLLASERLMYYETRKSNTFWFVVLFCFSAGGGVFLLWKTADVSRI